MRSVWIVVPARMASARYPGKALALLAGKPLLGVLLARMAAVRTLAGVALATSSRPENDPLAALAREAGGHRHRPPDHAAHRPGLDPRRPALPAAAPTTGRRRSAGDTRWRGRAAGQRMRTLPSAETDRRLGSWVPGFLRGLLDQLHEKG